MQKLMINRCAYFIADYTSNKKKTLSAKRI